MAMKFAIDFSEDLDEIFAEVDELRGDAKEIRQLFNAVGSALLAAENQRKFLHRTQGDLILGGAAGVATMTIANALVQMYRPALPVRVAAPVLAGILGTSLGVGSNRALWWFAAR